MSNRELTIYQKGALLYYELKKKAKRTPSFAGFLDPKIFAMSFGWFQTKRKRGYTEEQAEQFMRGFADAAKVKTLRESVYAAAMGIVCRSCSADEGMSCQTKGGRIPKKPHGRRLTDAVAKGLRENPRIVRDEEGLPTRMEW